jgi:hypothetical protein
MGQTILKGLIEDNTKTNNKNKNDTDLEVDSTASRILKETIQYWQWINSLAEHGVRWAIEELEQ